MKTASLLKSGPGNSHSIICTVFYCSKSYQTYPESKDRAKVSPLTGKAPTKFKTIFNTQYTVYTFTSA